MAGRDKLTPEGAALFKAIEELDKLEVRVGFQTGDAADDDTGADIADVAMWNELGTARIPSRPFMRQSVEKNAGDINAMCEAALAEVASGRSTAEQALNKIGMFHKGLIQNEIGSGGFTPNAPSTIKKKNSSKPLIDSGLMRQSVSYVIKQKGG